MKIQNKAGELHQYQKQIQLYIATDWGNLAACMCLCVVYKCVYVQALRTHSTHARTHALTRTARAMNHMALCIRFTDEHILTSQQC